MTNPTFALFKLGFRPFFLGAMVYAAIAMLLWLLQHSLGQAQPGAMPPTSWHGHEMIYGYGMAVVAGFLLTAVRNWTGRPTPIDTPLLLLFACWLSARLLPWVPLSGSTTLILMMAADLLFNTALLITLTRPIVQAKSWHNLAIMAKLLLLLASNLAFYLGILGLLDDGVRLGLYSGAYLLVALVFTIGRRVFPFFIERGVGYPVTLKNWRWLDNGSIVAFLGFWLVELWQPNSPLSGILAAILCILHSVRLWGWYTPGIWRRSLLWVLYLAYAVTVAGFALKVVATVTDLNANLAFHALVIGSIGVMTVGMMARVALGHTGRDLYQPRPALAAVFALLLLSVVFRVALPWWLPAHYASWLLTAQLLWITAFSVLTLVYLPILVKPRVDGKAG